MSFKQNFYKVQGKLSLFMFIYGIPKFIILLHSSLELKAIIVWLEAIHCLGDTFNSLIVFMLCKIFGKNKHELNDTKVEKIETIVGIICDLAIVFDSVELVSLLIIVIFKRDRFIRYLAPILCILISIVAIHESIIRINKQKELLDKICA